MDDHKKITRQNSTRLSKTPSPIESIVVQEDGHFVKSLDGTRNRKSIGTSRGKGISLNLAVSPINEQKVVYNPRSSVSPSSVDKFREIPEYQESYYETDNLHKVGESKYDFPLPTTESLLSMDIDEQLRLLALKEMFLVELKDNINELTTKLEQNENELHKLREVIQKSLYKELNYTSITTPRHQRSVSNPREEAISNTKNRSKRSLSFASNSKSAIHPTDSTTDSKANSTLWTNLSKPLHLIQQFDTMLSQEFEKSLVSTEQQQIKESPNRKSVTSSHVQRNSSLSVSSDDSISSPSKSKSDNLPNENGNIINTYHKPKPINSSIMNSDSKTEDMLQTVSTSIWSFVNEVKSNVLSSLGETEEIGKGTVLPQSRDDTIYDTDNIIDVENIIVDDMKTSRINDLEARQKLE